MRRLILATPLPAYAEADRLAEKDYHSALQTLAREYGGQWFDWARLVTAGITDYSRFFGDDAGGLLSSYPEQAAEKLAILLASELPEK